MGGEHRDHGDIENAEGVCTPRVCVFVPRLGRVRGV